MNDSKIDEKAASTKNNDTSPVPVTPQSPSEPLKPVGKPGVAKLNLDRTMRALMESYIGRIPENQRVASVRIAWQELWSRASRYLQKDDLMQVGDAFVYAAEAHAKQVRYSGDPYIVHSLGAASVLSDMQLDVQTLIAALLHDVIEDTEINEDEIAARFGTDVATLVDGVTKLGKLPFKNVVDYQAENLRKMFLVMAKDIRVVLIKLADRMHNMSTIQAHKREKQLSIARETLEIYAPLAHRLGIYHIKRELEDLSFKVIDPETYYDIRRRVRKKMPESENVIKKGMEILSERLKEEGITAQISGRPKHYYSIYEKMNRKNLALDQIYDLLALRVIVGTLAECYQVLGLVHTLWKPIPGQFDDYIANPKGNMYQSLHSTVVGPDGEPLEVQIRTWEMHRLAEYGIAAHWQYKEKGQKSRKDDMERGLTWIRQALEGQSEGTEPSEFLDHIKTDVLTTEVFVFTPQGKVISMPNGSTPIDFAYAVHTEVGHKCVGAQVNGRIVPMDYELQNGDIVRILTSPQGKPSRDWLKIAKSNRTRNKIRTYFRQVDRAEREDKLERGRELLDREIQRRYSGEGKTVDSFTSNLSHISNDLGYSGVEDLLVSIGNGHQTAAGVMSRVDNKAVKDAPEAAKARPKQTKEVDSVITVEGADGVLVSLAMCCCPIPGDKITGVVTQTRGITIHRNDCTNLERMADDKKVPVMWGEKRDIRYTARIKVEAADRVGVFADLGQAISQTDGQIVNIRGNVVNGTRSRFVIEIQVWDLEHLYRIIARINLVKGMIEIMRG